MAEINPYSDLPPRAYWRTGVVNTSPFELEHIYNKKFDIHRSMKIASAGSCFAQHIGQRLHNSGYNYLDLEPPPNWLPNELHREYGFSMYSARYGNVYTVQQLAQLAQEALSASTPEDIAWYRHGRVFDALRPQIELNGFSSEDELKLHRIFHIEKVRELFLSMDVFIFTLGLTEAWRQKDVGTVYPTAPGVFAGEFIAEKYEFVNFSYADICDAFDKFLLALKAIRGGQALPYIILTVSPVPLTATASGQHILCASTYSKSVLRTFASEICNHHDNIDYFPSYEIITNQANRGMFFDNNCRSVRKEGVDAVMRAFFQAHPSPSKISIQSEHLMEHSSSVRQIDGVQCEDAILEAFS